MKAFLLFLVPLLAMPVFAQNTDSEEEGEAQDEAFLIAPAPEPPPLRAGMVRGAADKEMSKKEVLRLQQEIKRLQRQRHKPHNNEKRGNRTFCAEISEEVDALFRFAEQTEARVEAAFIIGKASTEEGEVCLVTTADGVTHEEAVPLITGCQAPQFYCLENREVVFIRRDGASITGSTLVDVTPLNGECVE